MAEQRGISFRGIARQIGINYRAVANYLNGRGNSRRSTEILICRYFGLDSDKSENRQSPQQVDRASSADALETAVNLAQAKAEHLLLTDMAIEDSRLEIAPDTTTALERLTERVRVHGKRNQYGHKQHKNIVLSNKGLLEVGGDEPETVTEARAAQILGDAA